MKSANIVQNIGKVSGSYLTWTLIKVTAFQSYKIECVWKTPFHKSDHILWHESFMHRAHLLAVEFPGTFDSFIYTNWIPFTALLECKFAIQ